MIVTVEQILSWGPPNYIRQSELLTLVGSGLTPEQVAALPLQHRIRMWVLLHLMPVRSRRLVAACSSERGLATAGVTDAKCLAVPNVVRAHADDNATDDLLQIAQNDARDTVQAATSEPTAEAARAAMKASERMSPRPVGSGLSGVERVAALFAAAYKAAQAPVNAALGAVDRTSSATAWTDIWDPSWEPDWQAAMAEGRFPSVPIGKAGQTAWNDAFAAAWDVAITDALARIPDAVAIIEPIGR